MKRHRLLVAVFASMALAGWSADTEIIVESFGDGLNSQAFTKVNGKWNESTAKSTAEGLQASKSVYNDANTDPGTARFTPEIPVAGKYEVFITYPTSGNASDIKYTVVSADGTKDISLTQNGRDFGHTPGANEWYSLGTFTFNAGNSGYVEISDPLTGAKPLTNEPNARIYADAVKFVPVGMSLPAAPEVASATPATPTPAAGAVAAMPGLPGAVSATPAATGTAAAMPGLPGTPAAAATGPAAALPGLPSTPAAGLPALPTSTASAAQALPGLPAATGSTPAGMPGLPDVAPAQTAGGLPSLPSQTATATVTQSSVVTAQVTPLATPDLPSLAPVTPTPQRTIPSVADTPVAGVPSSLPSGPLASMTPIPSIPGAGLPTAPGTAGLPGAMPPSASPAVPGASITESNPSNLQWMYDFGAALNTARARNKKVMVFFTAEGNQAANVYETQYFMHPAVRQALNNYVLVKVDFPKNTRLGYSLGIFGAGIVVVTDPTGDVTARIEQLPATPTDLIKLMAGAQPAAKATPAAGAAATLTPAAGLPGAAPGAPVAPGAPAMPGAAVPIDGGTTPPQ